MTNKTEMTMIESFENLYNDMGKILEKLKNPSDDPDYITLKLTAIAILNHIGTVFQFHHNLVITFKNITAEHFEKELLNNHTSSTVN